MSQAFRDAFGSTGSDKLKPQYGNIKPPEESKATRQQPEMKTPQQMYADKFKELTMQKPPQGQKPNATILSDNSGKYNSQQSIAVYSSTGSLSGGITCDKLLLISRGMTGKVFARLDDYFLGPAQ